MLRPILKKLTKITFTCETKFVGFTPPAFQSSLKLSANARKNIFSLTKKTNKMDLKTINKKSFD